MLGYSYNITYKKYFFQVDLKAFDELYLVLKQDGTNFKANSNSVEEIDQKLMTMLERYDLEDTILAFKMVKKSAL